MTARSTKKGVKPLPYYRWYVGDYLASARVQKLTYIEKGLYRQLLDECWRKGYIPDDCVRLAEICGCPVGVMVKSWRALRKMWITLPYGDGDFLTSDRLEVERTEEDTKRVQASLAGQASAAKRNGRSTDVERTLYSSSISNSSSRNDRSLATPDGARTFAVVLAHSPAVIDLTAACVCGSRGASLAAGVHAPSCLSVKKRDSTEGAA
jgi:uncharacterized protein YdaU (DUF1376 family)